MLTREQLITSLAKWSEENDHDWHVSFEDECVMSITFEYLEDDDGED